MKKIFLAVLFIVMPFFSTSVFAEVVPSDNRILRFEDRYKFADFIFNHLIKKFPGDFSGRALSASASSAKAAKGEDELSLLNRKAEMAIISIGDIGVMSYIYMREKNTLSYLPERLRELNAYVDEFTRQARSFGFGEAYTFEGLQKLGLQGNIFTLVDNDLLASSKELANVSQTGKVSSADSSHNSDVKPVPATLNGSGGGGVITPSPEIKVVANEPKKSVKPILTNDAVDSYVDYVDGVKSRADRAEKNSSAAKRKVADLQEEVKNLKKEKANLSEVQDRVEKLETTVDGDFKEALEKFGKVSLLSFEKTEAMEVGLYNLKDDFSFYKRIIIATAFTAIAIILLIIYFIFSLREKGEGEEE